MGAATAAVGNMMYRLEQQLLQSSGAFELFSPPIEFVIRELSAGVALTENRQRLLFVPTGASIEERIDNVERNGDEEPHPEEPPEPHRSTEEAPAAPHHAAAVAPTTVGNSRSSRRN